MGRAQNLGLVRVNHLRIKFVVISLRRWLLESMLLRNQWGLHVNFRCGHCQIRCSCIPRSHHRTEYGFSQPVLLQLLSGWWEKVMALLILVHDPWTYAHYICELLRLLLLMSPLHFLRELCSVYLSLYELLDLRYWLFASVSLVIKVGLESARLEYVLFLQSPGLPRMFPVDLSFLYHQIPILSLYVLWFKILVDSTELALSNQSWILIQSRLVAKPFNFFPNDLLLFAAVLAPIVVCSIC